MSAPSSPAGRREGRSRVDPGRASRHAAGSRRKPRHARFRHATTKAVRRRSLRRGLCLGIRYSFDIGTICAWVDDCIVHGFWRAGRAPGAGGRRLAGKAVGARRYGRGLGGRGLGDGGWGDDGWAWNGRRDATVWRQEAVGRLRIFGGGVLRAAGGRRIARAGGGAPGGRKFVRTWPRSRPGWPSAARRTSPRTSWGSRGWRSVRQGRVHMTLGRIITNFR